MRTEEFSYRNAIQLFEMLFSYMLKTTKNFVLKNFFFNDLLSDGDMISSLNFVQTKD